MSILLNKKSKKNKDFISDPKKNSISGKSAEYFYEKKKKLINNLLTNRKACDIVTCNEENMDRTGTERQARYRQKLYKAGLKLQQVWVRRKETKKEKKMSLTEFIKRFRDITRRGFDEEETAQLYWLILKVAKGKKEENRIKKRNR